MRSLYYLALVPLLAACGVSEVGMTAATVAKLQADQAKQAQDSAARITKDLDAANRALEQRAAEIAEEKR